MATILYKSPLKNSSTIQYSDILINSNTLVLQITTYNNLFISKLQWYNHSGLLADRDFNRFFFRKKLPLPSYRLYTINAL